MRRRSREAARSTTSGGRSGSSIEQTGEQWIACRRDRRLCAWFVLGVEPLSHATLRARLQEIGVVGGFFEDHRPPHPKLTLYQLSEALMAYVEEAK